VAVNAREIEMKKSAVSTLPWLSVTRSRYTGTFCPGDGFRSAAIRNASVWSASFGKASRPAARIVTWFGCPVPFRKSSARQRGSSGWTTRAYAVFPWLALTKMLVADETRCPVGSEKSRESASPFSVRSAWLGL
jgi:hypothetical protein